VAVGDLLERCQGQLADLERFVEAYRRYCWPVAGVTDLKLAPFHVMATEGAVHTDKDHQWHMETFSALAAADDGLLLATANKVVDVMDPAARYGNDGGPSLRTLQRAFDRELRPGDRGAVLDGAERRRRLP